MSSIYRRALGAEFDRLHPRIRDRFGFSSTDRVVSVGRGEMERVWHARWAKLPLMLGATRNLMFADRGRRVPFTVQNAAYVDSFGRETVSWVRTFQFSGVVRRFDAFMVYSPTRRMIVDYLGDHQHLAVDLELGVADNGGIRICSGEQRFYEGMLGFRFPGKLTGTAEVCEWYDDQADLYRIRVEVSNPLFGPVFGYEGSFQAETLPMEPEQIPRDWLPRREESRE